MRAAVCIAGQPRQFKVGYEYLAASLADYDVDYFTHIWYNKDDCGKTLKAYSKKDPFIADIVTHNTDVDFLDLYNPKSHIIEKQIDFDKDIDLENNHGLSPSTVQPSEIFLSMIYSRWCAVQLLQRYLARADTDYDIVICTRTDFCPLTKLNYKDLHDQSIYFAYVPGTEWNTTCINDVFAISKSLDVIIHFGSLWKTYIELFNNGSVYCPHKLLMAQMKQCKLGTIFNKHWRLARSHGLSTS